MSVLPFPSQSDASAFGPESLSVLIAAFEDAWRASQTTGSTLHVDGHAAEHTRGILARCIIEMAKLGERDPNKLRDAALAHLAEANIRRERN
jgi:hypothetical protein